MNDLELIDINELESCFNISKSFVNKNYLVNLSSNRIVKMPEEIEKINLNNNIRLFKINKLVYDKEENILDKLSSLYNSLGNINSSVIIILDSNGITTEIYIGVKIIETNKVSASQAEEVLKRTFKGNFSGSEIEIMRRKQILPLLEKINESDIKHNDMAISCVSGIPSLKDDNKSKFTQGIEKLIDAMQGTTYTAIFIADPVSNLTAENIKSGYEDLYTRLVPFSHSQLSYGENDSEAVAKGLTYGITNSLSESISKTQSYTEGSSSTEGSSISEGYTYTQGYTNTYGESSTEGKSNSTSSSNSNNKSISKNKGGALNALSNIIGSRLFGNLVGSETSGISENTSTSNSINNSTGINTSEANSKSKASSATKSSNKSSTTNKSDTHGISEQTSKSESISNQESNTTTTTTGTSQNLQVHLENRYIKGILAQIDNQLKRIDNCKSFGMWNCASYFISEDISTSQVAASTFKSLMRGDKSCIEDSYINTWDSSNKINLYEVKKYIQRLSHPLIDVGINIGTGTQYVTPGSLISGNELAIQFSLPRKSITGLPVMEIARFGRNITTYDKNEDKEINLGKIFHMGSIEDLDVNINLNSLSMHTFITGSTGSGKSNTIYKLLNEVNKNDVKFLVIEPAKGEYKEVFGGRKDVSIFGTNPKFSDMLKINPFKFPKDIHILEHIDRLIEIFNACWPMYAAMPAVLKEAVEMSYERCGWDLDYSICVSNKKIYPTFNDLLDNLNIVISNSAYSEELKSNYTGALCTRVKSLTNGLLGRIFTSNEIDNEVLFDKNTIVDLSRIGSTETKSLITGILFIKLQEYRMTSNTEYNSQLRHITVLEEAHNLLRKTSSEQSQEGANLQGKSVEMISNSIAEMRTYGEGFIIADQAPNLLDDSAIRNTNTKIILRLPQQEDRESVGKSASLNNDQINEIPKLKTGVAVVYQNNWMEPILCKVDEFKDKSPLKYNFDVEAKLKKDKEITGSLLKLLLNARVSDENKIDMGIDRLDIYRKNEFLYSISEWLNSKDISNDIKDIINSNLEDFIKNEHMDLWNQEHFNDLCDVVNSFVDKNKMTIYSSSARDMNEWTTMSIEYIRNYIDLEENLEFEKSLLQCLLSSKSKENEGFKNFYFKWVEDNRFEGGRLI